MRRKKPTFRFICDKCGKDMPYDTDSKYNNENFRAIKTVCECGGKATITVVEDE